MKTCEVCGLAHACQYEHGACNRIRYLASAVEKATAGILEALADVRRADRRTR